MRNRRTQVEMEEVIQRREDSVRLSVRVDAAAHVKLRLEARRRGCSLEALARGCISEFLAQPIWPPQTSTLNPGSETKRLAIPLDPQVHGRLTNFAIINRTTTQVMVRHVLERLVMKQVLHAGDGSIA